jgi:DNA-binding MarR family transcriptional regulator
LETNLPGQDMHDDKPAERLSIAIGRVLKVEGSFEPESHCFMLNPSDLKVQSLVGGRPGCTLRDVAAVLGSALSTATTVVDRLTRKHMVVRQQVEENRSSVPLALTGADGELYRRLTAQQTRNCRAMPDALSADDQATYLFLANKIARAVDRPTSPVAE